MYLKISVIKTAFSKYQPQFKSIFVIKLIIFSFLLSNTFIFSPTTTQNNYLPENATFSIEKKQLKTPSLPKFSSNQTYFNSKNSLNEVSWTWHNFSFSIPINYSEQIIFDIPLNPSLNGSKTLFLPPSQQVKINTSSLYYNPVEIITNNSINWEDPVSVYSARIQKNADSVVISYVNEGFLGHVEYNYYNASINKNDLFSFEVNLTVRGDPNTDIGVPLGATYGFYLQSPESTYVIDYVLYAEQPISANTTNHYRVIKNNTLGQKTEINLKLPLEFIPLNERKNLSLVKEFITFTPGLSIEFTKPKIYLTKQVSPNNLQVDSQKILNISTTFDILNLQINTTNILSINIPEKTHGCLKVEYFNIIITKTNLTLQDSLSFSIINPHFIPKNSFNFSIKQITLETPFNSSFLITIGSTPYVIKQKLVLSNSNMINLFEITPRLLFEANISSLFLKTITLNHNLNDTINFNILSPYFSNITSLLFIYQNSSLLYFDPKPCFSRLSKNISIPLQLDRGFYWITYIVFYDQPMVVFQPLTVVTSLTSLTLSSSNNITLYRWFNNTISLLYVKKYSKTPIYGAKWIINIYSMYRTLTIIPQITIVGNQTILKFYLQGELKPGNYNLSVITSSNNNQNQCLKLLIRVSNVNPLASIIETTKNSICLKIVNINSIPIPNLLVSVSNLSASSGKTNNSGIVWLLFFETPPEIIILDLIYFDTETFVPLNISQIKTNYEPTLKLINTKIIANGTSFVRINIQIPPLFGEWKKKMVNNYTAISFIKNTNKDVITSLLSLYNSTHLSIKGDGKKHNFNVTILVSSPLIIIQKTRSNITALNIITSFFASEIFFSIDKPSTYYQISLLNTTASYTKINETNKVIWVKLIISKPGIYTFFVISVKEGTLNGEKDSSTKNILIILSSSVLVISLIIYFIKKKFSKDLTLDFDI